jgi:hypothetical protein
MDKEQPTKEEIEFRRAELEAFIRRYRLEGIDYVLDWVFTTIKSMISRGEVPASEKGVMKAISIIVSKYPEIDQYLKKFKIAVDQEMRNEMKQTARPN